MDSVRVFPLEQLEMPSACGQRVLVIKNEILPPLMIKTIQIWLLSYEEKIPDIPKCKSAAGVNYICRLTWSHIPVRLPRLTLAR